MYNSEFVPHYEHEPRGCLIQQYRMGERRSTLFTVTHSSGNHIAYGQLHSISCVAGLWYSNLKYVSRTWNGAVRSQRLAFVRRRRYKRMAVDNGLETNQIGAVSMRRVKNTANIEHSAVEALSQGYRRCPGSCSGGINARHPDLWLAAEQGDSHQPGIGHSISSGWGLAMKGVGEVIERSDSVILGARGSTFWRLAVPVVPPTSHTTASDNNNQRQKEKLY
jgi:hypothetical protein